jgi:hypothetical protein
MAAFPEFQLVIEEIVENGVTSKYMVGDGAQVRSKNTMRGNRGQVPPYSVEKQIRVNGPEEGVSPGNVLTP